MSRVCTNALERKSLTVAKSGCRTIARGKRSLICFLTGKVYIIGGCTNMDSIMVSGVTYIYI